MDFIRELITSPSFWIKLVIAILVIALATDMIRRLLARKPMNFGARTSKPAKVQAPAPKPAPAPKASASSKSGGSLLSIFLKTVTVVAGIAAVIAAIVFFFIPWLEGLPNNTPTRSSAAGMYAEANYPPSLTVPEGGKRSVPAAESSEWSEPVDIPLRLLICVDAQAGSWTYRVQCHDRHDAPGVWRDHTGEACMQADQERFQSKGAAQQLTYFFVPQHELC